MFEIKYFPEGHAEIQQAQTGHGTANPAGCNHALQSIKTSLTGSIKEKVIISPIAQTEKPLRNPWQER